MLKTIKTAFGTTIGVGLGIAVLGFIKKEIMEWGAKDEEFMNYEKEKDPDMYEELKKYQ